MEIFDITIIGAGPVGLFSTYYAGLRGMKTKLIDTLPELGGQLTTLYPEKYVYDVPGFPRILARDLAGNLVRQGLQYNPTVCLGEQIISFEREEDENGGRFHLVSGTGNHHRTRSLLITAGIGSFAPRKLELPEAAAFEEHGVIYFLRDITPLAGKNVLIIGGGDSAVDWALNLIDRVGSVTLIHRRERFNAHDDSVKKLFASRAVVKTSTRIGRIIGNDRVEKAMLVHTVSGEEQFIDVDFIFPNLGFIANPGPLREWGIAMERNDIIVNSMMETNIPGIYAAGDITAYAGKLKLIATGFGEGVIAVNSAKVAIDPKAKYFPGHSSDMKRSGTQ